MSAYPWSGPLDESARLAMIGISRVVAAGDERTWKAVRERGPVGAWEQLRSRPGARPPELDLARLHGLGARVVFPGDAEWPTELDDLGRCYSGQEREPQLPFALFVRGPMRLDEIPERAAAIVGSRAATPYGTHVASQLACGLSDAGWVVVSGAAYGIDGAAHRGALAGPTPTVAVLAGSVDRAYPVGHERLLQSIAETGAVISEVPPGCAAHRHRFLSRNRVIAALTRGTVLVEAAFRSGALNTVRHARALGRPVLAVPGPVTSAMSAGCHVELRREGTRLVTSAPEVVEELGRIGELAPLPVVAAGPRDSLGAIAVRVLDAVPVRRPAGAASIAAAAAVTERDVVLVMDALVEAGLVERVPGGYLLTELGRRPSSG